MLYLLHQLCAFAYVHCFHIATQIDRQATRALNSTETDDSVPSSIKNAVITYLSEDVKSVSEVFPEDQRMWSVLLIFFSPHDPLRYGKRCVPITESFPSSPNGDVSRSLLRDLSVKSYLTILGSYLPTSSQEPKSLGGMHRNNNPTKDDPRKFWVLNSML